jgi:hypothetical protein
MANKPLRLNVNKAQIPLVNRCLSASSLPTRSALFSHFLALYGEDYIRRYGVNENPPESISGEPNRDERNPIAGMKGSPLNLHEPKKVLKPAVSSPNHPIVEIICE